MNVREFYADDPHRRESAEVTFGLEWRVETDPSVLFGLHWIEDTREIYLMREPQPPLRTTVFDPRLNTTFALPLTNDELEVELLGWAENRPALETALVGWVEHMHDHNSLQWVRDRLEEAAAATLRERGN